MSETDRSLYETAPLDNTRGDERKQDRWEFDFTAAVTWMRNHRVLLCGLLLIIAEIIWKARFLNHMFFSQDDYVNLDIAITSPFSWHYLTLIGAGHLYPGLRAVTWVLARISLYNWGLDAGLALALVAASSLALLRLLRTLFGERWAIIIPLALYALTPLTVPDLGWWWCAMESLPFQLAIFMCLNAHVQYIRTRRARHLATAASWLVVGLLFFEKAIVLAPLLLAITAAFQTEASSWLGGVVATVRQHWRAWAVYGGLMIIYGVFFFAAFRTSAQNAQVPSSASAALGFGSTLFRDTLMTGAVGGPWRWLPLSTGLYALASPPAASVWFSELAVAAVVGISVLLRPLAWRAWAILVGWVLCADMLPVIFGRLGSGLQGILGLETRYLADAACVMAICLGLAFLPVLETRQPETRQPEGLAGLRLLSSWWHRARVVVAGSQNLRYGAAALIAVFAVSSVWSVRTYEDQTPGGAAARSYIANVKKVVRLAPPGTNVLNQYMPQKLVEGLFGKRYASESSVIGDLARGKLAGNIHWINKPVGTIDGLRMFGSDGKLYPAIISGVYSVHRPGPGFKACWPERHGQIVVKLQHTTSIYDWTLHIAYIWGSRPSIVTVEYGNAGQGLRVRPKIHSVYLSVSGDVSRFVVSGLGTHRMCVAGAEAGELVPFGVPIP